MTAPAFDEGQTVIGQSFLEFIEWAKNSLQPDSASDSVPDKPLLLPPVQRSAVWNAKKIVDLWDSVLRGLPIGIFYLLTRDDGEQAMDINGKLVRAAGGFDLLDGQQRLRALLLGWTETCPDDRCLWVDLAPENAPAGAHFRLFITSKTQPFGYDPATGQKWPTLDRRKARENIERDPKDHPFLVLDDKGNYRLGEDGKPRPAYDSELFAGVVVQDGERIAQPPKPHKSNHSATFKLSVLLREWKENPGMDALFKVAPCASKDVVRAIDAAFGRLKAAQVALLKVDLGSLKDDDALALFERIGAGGERLSDEERLYSIYKYHVPEIRGVVDKISDEVGKILPPTKIVTTALRIANARKKRSAYSVPDVVLFAKEMKDQGSELGAKLKDLLPLREHGALDYGFNIAKNILSFHESAGAFWIPDVLLATLPPGVWQVLVFWVCSLSEGIEPERVDWKQARKEAVRFALFWRLCVWNDDKATVHCFEYLNGKHEKEFPGTALYQKLVRDGCALELIPACDFRDHFSKLGKSPFWRTDPERFGMGPKRNEMCARWWIYGAALLPWLQRDYIKKEFNGYAPLTEHEDDIPYDIDHICPKNDWRDSGWPSFKNRLDEDVDVDIRQSLYDARDQVGNWIGNLRLVGSAQNRHDGDADLAEKMRFIMAPENDGFNKGMKDWAFPADVAPWQAVSRNFPKVAERRWNKDRLQAFQQAVEDRAVYLYARFHDDLEYSLWTSSRDKTEAREA